MIRIGIYPRKSVYRDNSESVAVQVKICQDYANLICQGNELAFYIYDKDEGFSGKNTNRPSFQELMRDVCDGLLDVVIVYKLDRISRNVQEFSSIFEVFRAHKVSFVSVKESFDTDSPIGRTVMYILAAFSQLEREQISIRVADNMQALGASGKWTGGKLPVGMTSICRKNDGKTHSYLTVDPDTIWRVRLLYDLLLGGYTITGIERYLRDHNITSQSGKFMSTSQIYSILTNPVYCQNDAAAYDYFRCLGCRLGPEGMFTGMKGLMSYGKTRTAGDSSASTQQKTAYSDWSISIGIHDWVIPSGRWIAAQQRLGINKQIRSNKYQVGILKGLLRCGCGAGMANRVYVKNDNVFAYYYCQDAARKGCSSCQIRYHRIADIDRLFIRKLKEIRPHPDFIRPREHNSMEYTDISGIHTNIRLAETAIHNLTARLYENTASAAAKYIIEQIEELDQKLSSLRSQLKAAQIRLAQSNQEQDNPADLYKNICRLLEHFEEMEYTEKNELAKKISKKCVLDGENLEIVF